MSAFRSALFRLVSALSLTSYVASLFSDQSLRHIPHIGDFEIRKALGRWYLVKMHDINQADYKHAAVIDLSLNQTITLSLSLIYQRNDTTCTSSVYNPDLTEWQDAGSYLFMDDVNPEIDGDMLFILGTDYMTYIVSFMCVDVTRGRCVSGHIDVWSRTTTFNSGTVNDVNQDLRDTCGLSDTTLFKDITYDGRRECHPSPAPCLIDSKPYDPDVHVEKLLGRWYTHFLLMFSNVGAEDIWEASVMDLYQADHGGFEFIVWQGLTDRPWFKEDTSKLVPQGDGRYMMEGPVTGLLHFLHVRYDSYISTWFCTAWNGNICTDPSGHIFTSTQDMPPRDLDDAMLYLAVRCHTGHEKFFSTANYTELVPLTPDNCYPGIIPYMVDLDQKQLSGVWHLVRRYGGPGVNVAENVNLSIKVRNWGYDLNIITFERQENGRCTRVAEQSLTPLSHGGKFEVNAEVESEMWIVHADYEKYFVAYTCGDKVNCRCLQTSVTIWSRTTVTPPEDIDAAMKWVNRVCFVDLGNYSERKGTGGCRGRKPVDY